MTHSFLSPCINLAITQPAHPSGAVGAPDDLLPLLSECVSHTGTEGGSCISVRTGRFQPHAKASPPMLKSAGRPGKCWLRLANRYALHHTIQERLEADFVCAVRCALPASQTAYSRAVALIAALIQRTWQPKQGEWVQWRSKARRNRSEWPPSSSK